MKKFSSLGSFYFKFAKIFIEKTRENERKNEIKRERTVNN